MLGRARQTVSLFFRKRQNLNKKKKMLYKSGECFSAVALLHYVEAQVGVRWFLSTPFSIFKSTNIYKKRKREKDGLEMERMNCICISVLIEKAVWGDALSVSFSHSRGCQTFFFTCGCPCFSWSSHVRWFPSLSTLATNATDHVSSATQLSLFNFSFCNLTSNQKKKENSLSS